MNAWILNLIACLLYLRLSNAELKFVQTLFRHGNRIPIKGTNFYPKDPYINMTYEPDGYGALTNVGKMAAYKLGQYFRERYGEFLGPLYSKDIIWFRADEVDRVVMSGQLVAAGLYPPVKEQRWNPHLNWQPIPVWAPPMSTDYLYNGVLCANTKKWRSDVEKTDKDVINYVKANAEVYKYLSQHTGGNITQQQIFKLRQLLFAQRDIGLKLPQWTKPVFPGGKLDELAVADILIQTRSFKSKKLLGGVWIKEFLQNVDNFINKNDTRKALMYAGHELTLAYLLVALDNFNNKVPYYCSTIMFELHEVDNEYYIQMLYKDKDDVRSLKIPGCDDKMCLVSTFKKFAELLIPQDVVAMCGNADVTQAVKNQSNY